MDNPAYSYDGLWLWDREAWVDRYSPITHLARWIEVVNHRTVRDESKLGAFAGRTDGDYTWKTRSNSYPDVVDAWRERGLSYVTDEMGQVTWIAMIPVEVDHRAPQRILLRFHDADYTDPNWAMDALEFYRETLESAADEGVVTLIVAPDGVDESHIYVHLLQELSSRYHLNYGSLHLDVSALGRDGARLADVPDFRYPDAHGEPVSDLDGAIAAVAGVPALDITHCWDNLVSQLWENAHADRYASDAVNMAHVIRSEAGKRMAEGLALEHEFTDSKDPAFAAHWEAIGVRFETHDRDGQQWVSLAPAAAYEPAAPAELPLMFIFEEATYTSPFQAVGALSSYYQYVELVAQGELMVIFFALETPEDNDLAIDIIHDAAGTYPIDLSRVYVTGHSHNGHLAMEFARRHHGQIAAAASLGNAYGLPAPEYSHEHVKLTDERVELMASYDMPVIDIAGYSESDFVFNEVGSEGFAHAVDSWRRRAKAFRLPLKSEAEIAAAKTGSDEVSRRIGVPTDRSMTQYRMGSNCWIGDFDTIDGKHRLRLVALEHFPHMIAPQMPALSWDFVRRFARNLQNGEVIER